MAKIKITAYAIMRDCGDGSQSCKLVGTKEEALKALGYKSEEDMQENWSCFYDNGGFEEVSFEIEEKDGIFSLSKGFYVDTDGMDMN